MKKLFQSFLYGSIALIGSINYAQAQEVAFASNIPNTTDAASLNAIINSPVTSTAKPLAHVNSKLARMFAKFYKDAQNVQWYNNGNGFIAMFDQAGMKSHASFGKYGYWYYNVHFGTENDLPADVRRTIKSNYVDYSIGRSTEVAVRDQKAWIVNLEDKNNLVQVRVMDGALDELAHYDTHGQAKTKKGRIVIPQ